MFYLSQLKLPNYIQFYQAANPPDRYMQLEVIQCSLMGKDWTYCKHTHTRGGATGAVSLERL